MFYCPLSTSPYDLKDFFLILLLLFGCRIRIEWLVVSTGASLAGTEVLAPNALVLHDATTATLVLLC